jgi:ABC-2 type transport system ATP-binding protein
VDGNLTGLENLEMVGRLYHLSKAEARRRAGEVLERFGLAHAADRTARTYSGGMRRRLDLGASLVGRPKILFLDEPTTGLDPRSRLALWEMIRDLRREGATLLLTTQYLEEADNLADRVAVIDVGQVIAEGTSDELKNQMGGEVLELHVAEKGETAKAAEILTGVGAGEHVVDLESGLVRVQAGTDGTSVVFEAVRRLDDARIWVADLALHKPTLDDVFLTLTGHAAEQEAEDEETAEVPAKGRRGRGEGKA